MCICFIILMHHMYVRPYKVNRVSLAGAFSASALLMVGTINLMRACFKAAEYIPQGPYKILMEVCEDIENTLVLWLHVCQAIQAHLWPHIYYALIYNETFKSRQSE